MVLIIICVCCRNHIPLANSFLEPILKGFFFLRLASLEISTKQLVDRPKNPQKFSASLTVLFPSTLPVISWVEDEYDLHTLWKATICATQTLGLLCFYGRPGKSFARRGGKKANEVWSWHSTKRLLANFFYHHVEAIKQKSVGFFSLYLLLSRSNPFIVPYFRLRGALSGSKTAAGNIHFCLLSPDSYHRT